MNVDWMGTWGVQAEVNHLPFRWQVTDENLASGLCYTSGTTGNPKVCSPIPIPYTAKTPLCRCTCMLCQAPCHPRCVGKVMKRSRGIDACSPVLVLAHLLVARPSQIPVPTLVLPLFNPSFTPVQTPVRPLFDPCSTPAIRWRGPMAGTLQDSLSCLSVVIGCILARLGWDGATHS